MWLEWLFCRGRQSAFLNRRGAPFQERYYLLTCHVHTGCSCACSGPLGSRWLLLYSHDSARAPRHAVMCDVLTGFEQALERLPSLPHRQRQLPWATGLLRGRLNSSYAVLLLTATLLAQEHFMAGSVVAACCASVGAARRPPHHAWRGWQNCILAESSLTQMMLMPVHAAAVAQNTTHDVEASTLMSTCTCAYCNTGLCV